MKQPIQLTNTIPSVRTSLSWSPLPSGSLLIPLALVLACCALPPASRALLPPPAPDGGYPGLNTAEGDNALFSLTTGVANTATGAYALWENSTGSENTAYGFAAARSNTDGSDNAATGAYALSSNTKGSDNTATGVEALFCNTTGSENTANGRYALACNNGSYNTATGSMALSDMLTGDFNTADGYDALFSNTSGGVNTAMGFRALFSNTEGSHNTANGADALFNNSKGIYNTAIGEKALSGNTAGSRNIALGFNAGVNLTTGSNNIDIGNMGVAEEDNTIRIGRVAPASGSLGSHFVDTFGQTRTFVAGINGAAVTGSAVYVNSSGQLGTVASSERFKDAICPMHKASGTIFALKPVTFRYKKDLDPEGFPQFGLVAEEVQKVNPALVVRDKEGKPYSVRYDAVNAMLLNEFLKEHRTVQGQQKEIDALKAELKEQRALIQKVNDKVELDKSAPQTVLNNQ
jgi:trimeric autotransporter adhesin